MLHEKYILKLITEKILPSDMHYIALAFFVIWLIGKLVNLDGEESWEKNLREIKQRHANEESEMRLELKGGYYGNE